MFSVFRLWFEVTSLMPIAMLRDAMVALGLAPVPQDTTEASQAAAETALAELHAVVEEFAMGNARED